MEESPQLRATIRSNRSASQPMLNLNMENSQIGMSPLNKTNISSRSKLPPLNLNPVLEENSIMGLGDDVPNNISIESGNNYGVLDDFPLDALALDPTLMTYAGIENDVEEDDQKRAQKLREARLAEALEKQTALLDSIGQSYKRNKDIRQKAEVRKLKNRLEKLENDKMFRELEIQQAQMANDIAQQNNQLIFSHLNAEAQLRANPIILSLPTESKSSLNPLLLHAALRSMSNKNQNQPSRPVVNLGMIPGGRPFPGPFPGPGPMPGMQGMPGMPGQIPPFRQHPGIGMMGPPMRPGPFGPMPFPQGPGGKFGGPMPPFMGMGGMGMGMGMGPPPFMGQPFTGKKKKGKSIGGGPVKLPPLNLKTARDRDSDDEDDSREIRTSRKDVDVKKYLDQVLTKHRGSMSSRR